MKNKYSLFIGGRVGEACIETTKPDSNNKYLGNMLVSIRPSKSVRGYSTNGVFYETN
jgi:hypothetical protein